MMIRDAKEKDIPRIFKAIRNRYCKIHADIRPDIFIPGTTKYTIDELREILKNKKSQYLLRWMKRMFVWGMAFCQLQEQPVFKQYGTI